MIDSDGGYVLVRGELDGKQIVLGSIYTPNSDQMLFLHKLSNRLAGWSGCQ